MAQSQWQDIQEVSAKVKKPCPQCLKILGDDERYLTCHGCFEDIHCVCFIDPINSEAYEVLKEELSSVFIFCPPCKAKLFAHNVFDKPISADYENRLETLETQMSRLISLLTESSSETRKNIASSVLNKTHHTYIIKKSTAPINGTSSKPTSPSSPTPYLSPKSWMKEDFGLALSSHDLLKQSSSERDSRSHCSGSSSSSSRSGIRSPPSVDKSLRPMPYPIRGLSNAADPVKGTEVLKSCCFRKPKDNLS